MDESDVLEALRRLSKDEVIDYKAGHTDLEIRFLVPREDDHTINAFIPQMLEHQQRKTDQFEAMLYYVSNSRRCRVRQLLNYFSEESEVNCGQCDVCRNRINDSKTNMQSISSEILIILEQSNKTSRELIKSLPYAEKEVLLMLQQMLENEMIAVNAKNEYLRLR